MNATFFVHMLCRHSLWPVPFYFSTVICSVLSVLSCHC